MAAIGFRRVSKKRPCLVCGKPDWCSTTATETISFCARSNLNADRISQFGWGVYYRDRYDLVFDRPTRKNTKRKRAGIFINRASAVIRDRIYRTLIRLSPASSNPKIVQGLGGLCDRSIPDHSQYGNLPSTVTGRNALVERLTKELGNDVFEGVSYAGVPGFWKDATDEWRLWTRFDSRDALLLIPFVGPDGLIQACQIRYMQHVHGRSGNYVWLSSGKERMGASPGSPLHHAAPGVNFDKPVLVTEGALKAATAQRFLADRYVVGNSGVATAHKEIVETARGKSLEIAFDNDSFSNPHVARALASLVALRQSDQAVHGYNDEVYVLAWDRSLKGIDEAVSRGASIDYLTVSKWLQQISPPCFEQAVARLSLTHKKEAVGSGCNEPLQSFDQHLRRR